MKTICIFLAEGFEEMEAMFPLDVMRRGGLNVKTVSVTGEKTVVSSHQVPIVADMLFEDLKEEDVEMVVLPGGLPGATNLDAHAGLDKLIMSFAAAGKPLAAICAAPMVYGKRGLLKGKKATCYPGFTNIWKVQNIQAIWLKLSITLSWVKVRVLLRLLLLLFWKNMQEQKKLWKLKKECCLPDEEIYHCRSRR